MQVSPLQCAAIDREHMKRLVPEKSGKFPSKFSTCNKYHKEKIRKFPENVMMSTATDGPNQSGCR